MRKMELNYSEELGESTYKTTLENGLSVYICKKNGFSKKIGMFGTKYGSIHNDFVNIETNERIQVPDGIAHFLEHKLFEKEGANALDLFSKMGVSSNAYTSFDQTVYYFETSEKLESSISMLVKLIKEPYFTDENVKKEQGIIGQEISMYNDNPWFMVYFNTLRAMYKENPVNIDIAGTVESISNINKELLYTCYNTFYSPQNMFFVVVGDVDVDKTINMIEKNIKLYSDKNNNEEIEKFLVEEDLEIAKKEITEKLDIYLPQMCIGYKLDVVEGKEILKREHIADIISYMYFSKISEFFEKEYNEGKINENVEFQYEGAESFSHIMIAATSTDIDIVEKDIIDYIEKIKNEPINEELFELAKKKKIGNDIMASDNLNTSYRRIINSIISGIEVYDDIETLKNITKEDIKEFLMKLNEEVRVTSKIIAK